MVEKKKKKDTRARVWTVIVYPDSAPANWKQILDSKHIPFVCSPLHDKDVNPDGTIKKSHWHVVFIFSGLKSYSQMLNLTKELNSPIPQKVDSLKGMIRYLIHLDNPEKYQYRKQEIDVHGDIDILPYFESSGSRRNELMAMVKYIKTNNITNIADFADQIIDEGNAEWFDILANHNTLFLKEIIKGIWLKNNNHQL